MLGAVVFLGGFMGAALFRAGGGSDFRRLSLYCYAVPSPSALVRSFRPAG